MKFLGKKPVKPALAGVAAVASGPAAGTTRQRGNAAEDRALAYLQAQGLQLLERNYRTPGRGGGEIDLVLRDRDGTVVFVEVRSRSSRATRSAAGSSGARFCTINDANPSPEATALSSAGWRWGRATAASRRTSSRMTAARPMPSKVVVI